MRDDSTRLILREFAELKRLKPDFRVGTVTATSPLSVKIGDSATAYVSVKALDGVALAVGQVVICAVWGNDLLVLGRATGTPSTGEVQRAVSTSSLALTTTMQNVPGASITLAKTGSFKGTIVLDFNISATGVGNCLGEIRNTTTGVSYQYALFASNSIGRATVAQTAVFAATAGDVLVLRASKGIAAGTASTESQNSLLIEQYA